MTGDPVYDPKFVTRRGDSPSPAEREREDVYLRVLPKRRATFKASKVLRFLWSTRLSR